MTGFYVAVAALVLVALWGFASGAVKAVQARDRRPGHRPGWLYFVTAPAQDNAPVKIGITERDPSHDRLPELRTMSPFPLKVIAKFPVTDRYIAEASVHEELSDYRLHGEWFDRDAALMYIDHLKGAV
jgi:Meiotically up-regulated gene 113